jgi:hypothetical protein
MNDEEMMKGSDRDDYASRSSNHVFGLRWKDVSTRRAAKAAQAFSFEGAEGQEAFLVVAS